MQIITLPADFDERVSRICQQADTIAMLADRATRELADVPQRDLNRILDKLSGNTPSLYCTEIGAIASRLGLPPDQIWLMSCFDEMVRLAGVGIASACSSLAVADERGMVIGRNLDYGDLAPLLRRHLCRYDFEAAETRHGFASWAWPGYLGLTTGANEKGLWLATHTVPHGEFSLEKGMPNSMLYRLILEQAASIDEAEDLLRHYPPTCPANLMVGDFEANGAVVFEIASNGFHKCEMVEFINHRYLACTNQFHGQGLYGSSNSHLRYLHLEQKGMLMEMPFAYTEMQQTMATWGIARDDTVYSIVAHPMRVTGYIGTGGYDPDPNDFVPF